MLTISLRQKRLIVFVFYTCRYGTWFVRNINMAFENNPVSKWTVRFWFQQFAREDFSLENKEWDQPKVSIDDNLKALLEIGSKTSVKEHKANFNVSKGIISSNPLRVNSRKKKFYKCIHLNNE